MTIQELRVFLSEWFCGCGSPEDAAEALRKLLSLHPPYDHRKEFEAWIQDSGLAMLVLYTLDHFGLTEHGGTVGGGWLTDKGQAVLAALEAASPDHFAALESNWCIHGYSLGEPCPECAKLNAPSEG